MSTALVLCQSRHIHYIISENNNNNNRFNAIIPARGVGNLRSNFLWPIVRILYSQAILFQILVYALFPQPKKDQKEHEWLGWVQGLNILYSMKILHLVSETPAQTHFVRLLVPALIIAKDNGVHGKHLAPENQFIPSRWSSRVMF